MNDSTASPCVNICRMNPTTGLCDGCLRTLDEIAGWGGYSESRKQEVIRAIEAGRPGGGRRGAAS